MCNCIAEVNKDLRKYNTEVHYSINMLDVTQPKRIYLITVKADENVRGKPINVIATYCPFCGEKYVSQEAAHGQ